MLLYKNHCNDARQAVRESGVDTIVEKDESVILIKGFARTGG